MFAPLEQVPKLTEFPVDDIVTYSIVVTAEGFSPPIHTARVAFETDSALALVVVKSPKSNAFPVVAIVM